MVIVHVMNAHCMGLVELKILWWNWTAILVVDFLKCLFAAMHIAFKTLDFLLNYKEFIAVLPVVKLTGYCHGLIDSQNWIIIKFITVNKSLFAMIAYTAIYNYIHNTYTCWGSQAE